MMESSDYHLTEEQLHDAAEGISTAAEQRVVDAHLGVCIQCREDVDRIAAFLVAAKTLPRDIEPPAGLWASIRGRIGEQGARRPDDVSVPGTPAIERPMLLTTEHAHSRDATPNRPRHQGIPRRLYPWLAAAAVLLVLASSAVTALFVRDTASTAPATASASDSGGDTHQPTFTTVSDEYDRMDRDLAALLATHREKLAPETIAKVERNLLIIDQAIADIRKALAEDPSNKALQQLLKASYGQKAALLRQVSQS